VAVIRVVHDLRYVDRFYQLDDLYVVGEHLAHRFY
jgi:hypothetical protein